MQADASTWFDKWRIGDARRKGLWRRINEPQLFVFSFLLLIATGTLGLKLLPRLYTGAPLGWLDSIFTITSAVCVTGLTVVDTATYFTFWGQAWILLYIQLGGLGIIAFTSVIIVALGKRLSLRQEGLSASAAEIAPHVSRKNLIRDVILFTFGIELLGATALWIVWTPEMGWRSAAWPAIFHSISAFCNAGFSTWSDSLMGHRGSPATLGIVMGLIMLGGIGFLTLEELALWGHARRRRRFFRISIHSRLVLATTAILIVAGWGFFSLFEWHRTLADMTLIDKLVNALFMSVTPRTAGFNTVDYGATTDSTNFLTILLMFIGGSPGSTAGGIKTTALALIALLGWSRLRGRTLTDVWGRSIPDETIQRAVGLTVMAFIVVTIGIFILTASELRGQGAGGFMHCMFEVTSAFNTVGLSMDLTPHLSDIGRWTAISLMFLGRVGPLTFAAALARERSGSEGFRFAYEDVVVG